MDIPISNNNIIITYFYDIFLYSIKVMDGSTQRDKVANELCAKTIIGSRFSITQTHTKYA